jgi:hypothetical protein
MLASQSSAKKLFCVASSLLALLLFASLGAGAQTESTIFTFETSGAYAPNTGLASDSAGNLYGVAGGGVNQHGVVYELTPVSGGWQETILYTFTGGSDGGSPTSTPLLDAAGNIYGAAAAGGTVSQVCGVGCGVIYKLSPTSGGAWEESVLYAFSGKTDGAGPGGNLVFDKAGNLYGSDAGGGNLSSVSCQNTSGCGVIFKLTPADSGPWSFTLLHTFTGYQDGVGPAQLIFDKTGNLFGSAAGAWGGYEGPSEPGLVFRLIPTPSGPWKDAVVYAFTGGADGGLPGGMAFDSEGNLYGSGADGGLPTDSCESGYGVSIGCGVVFKLSPNSQNGKWTETVLYSFKGKSDGAQPDGAVIFDNGKLYGTTWGGGVRSGNCGGFGCGVVYGLGQAADGSWIESVAYAFSGTDGVYPVGRLTVDQAGNLYGTTYNGGGSNWGVAFQITP